MDDAIRCVQTLAAFSSMFLSLNPCFLWSVLGQRAYSCILPYTKALKCGIVTL
jgi:hypothetical protein